MNLQIGAIENVQERGRCASGICPQVPQQGNCSLADRDGLPPIQRQFCSLGKNWGVLGFRDNREVFAPFRPTEEPICKRFRLNLETAS